MYVAVGIALLVTIALAIVRAALGPTVFDRAQAWLVLEDIPFGRPGPRSARDAGRRLAALVDGGDQWINHTCA